MELLVPPEELVSGKITFKSKLKPIMEIKGALSKDELDLFKESCFGQFLDMDISMPLSGSLLHYLSGKRVRHDEGSEFWFDINHRPVRFSVVEFALITGLKCAEESDVSIEQKENTILKDKYFSGSSGRITAFSLEKQFGKMGECEDRVRIALVWFLNAVLLSQDEKVCISFESLSLANDLDAFNAYPWGRLVYKATYDQFNKNFEGRTGEYKYTLLGFPWAIQYWAFEMFNKVAAMFVTRDYDRYPSIRNWRSSKKRAHTDTIGKILETERDFDATLRAMEIELAQPYMQNIGYTEDDIFLVQRIMGKRGKGKQKITIKLQKEKGKEEEKENETKKGKGKEKENEKETKKRKGKDEGKEKETKKGKEKEEKEKGKGKKNEEPVQKRRKVDRIPAESTVADTDDDDVMVTMGQLKVVIANLQSSLEKKIDNAQQGVVTAIQTLIVPQFKELISKEVEDVVRRLELSRQVEKIVETTVKSATEPKKDASPTIDAAQTVNFLLRSSINYLLH